MTPDRTPVKARAVYDTNVLISGLFWRGKPRHLIHLARAGEIDVLTCRNLLDEIKAGLTRGDKPFQLSAAEADDVIADVLKYAQPVTIVSRVDACRDQNDNVVLACAIDGKAEYVVTGDPDLLVLKEFEGVKIITVAEFTALVA